MPVPLVVGAALVLLPQVALALLAGAGGGVMMPICWRRIMVYSMVTILWANTPLVAMKGYMA